MNLDLVNYSNADQQMVNAQPAGPKRTRDEGTVEPLLFSDFPSEVLARIVCYVANHQFFTKSCQNLLSVNKRFYYDITEEVLKLDGQVNASFDEILAVSDPNNMTFRGYSKGLLTGAVLGLPEKSNHHSEKIGAIGAGFLRMHDSTKSEGAKRKTIDEVFLKCIKNSPSKYIEILNIDIKNMKNNVLSCMPLRFPNCRVLAIQNCSTLQFSSLFSFFKNLQALELNHCENLDDAVISPFQETSALQWLSLSKHTIDDFSLTSVALQASLQTIKLSDCHNLTSLPISHLTHLRHLLIAQCKKMTKESLAEILTLKNLQTLSLDLTQRQELPDCSGHPELQEITLKGLSAPQALALSDLPKLQKCTIENSKRLDTLALSKLPMLQEVSVNKYAPHPAPSITFSEVPTMKLFDVGSERVKVLFSPQK